MKYLLYLLACFACLQSNAQFKKLVWADEFNRDGLPDSTKWGYDKGNHGWGNNELQYYTHNRLQNSRVEKGMLVIEAVKENYDSSRYTSARLLTKNKGDWKYGRVEVRAKLPKGRGIWPAIWMLPTKWEYGGWPRSGEIDIMEFVGYLPDSVYGTVHTKAFNHTIGTQSSGSLYRTDLSEAFHVYSMEWTADKISFFIDGVLLHDFANNKAGIDAWPFDKEFHLLLDVAVGGNWGGKMGVDNAIFPQRMLVDYVRVYQ